MKYKYSRKEIARKMRKWWTDYDTTLVFEDFMSNLLSLADKPFTEKDYKKLQKDLDNAAGHEPTGIFANKADKPKEEFYGKGEGEYACEKIGKVWFTPKTKTEIEKIRYSELEGRTADDTITIVDKINQLIDRINNLESK